MITLKIHLSCLKAGVVHLTRYTTHVHVNVVEMLSHFFPAILRGIAGAIILGICVVPNAGRTLIRTEKLLDIETRVIPGIAERQ